MEDQIRKLAEEMGAGEVGFCSLKPLSDFNRVDVKLRRNYPSAISVVIPLLRGIMAEIEDKPTITYFAHYRAVNRMIDEMTLRISLLLEKKGYCSFAVPASQSDPEDGYAGVFPHKTAAVLSGMGWIGKNGLFIHRSYGSAVRLGTVLTDLPAEEKKIMSCQCGSCTLCRDHCPAMAIEGRSWQPGMERKMLLDVRACSDHMKEAYQMIGRGSVCGLCMTCCPYMRK